MESVQWRRLITVLLYYFEPKSWLCWYSRTESLLESFTLVQNQSALRHRLKEVNIDY